jgi:hypothetical protein
VPTQHRSDARLRHADAEFLKLADDAEISPPGIFPSDAADQLDGLIEKGRTSRRTVRVGPVPADQCTVPTEDGLWPDEERAPALARHETSEEDDEGTVGPGEAGTGDLAAQHGQLVAEHEDLGVLGGCVHAVDAEHFQDAPDETVEEGERHGGRASPSSFPLVKLARRVSGPFRLAPGGRTRAPRCRRQLPPQARRRRPSGPRHRRDPRGRPRSRSL